MMRAPVMTAVLAVVTLSISLSPGLSSLFVLDREAVARGEIWRILTGHFVHFSGLHLTYNLIVFVIAGSVVERYGRRDFSWLCIWLALTISVSLFVLKPDMAYYGGMSGVACGVVYYWGVMGLKSERPGKFVSLLIVVLVPLKIFVEMYHGASVLPYREQQTFVPMHASHAVGCLVAVLYYFNHIFHAVSDHGRGAGDRFLAL